MRTLAIETSCDDTSIWIISYQDTIFSVEKLLAYSQVPDHQKYGWVVPEIASRLHSEKIVKVLENIWYESIKNVDFISVTAKPGLPGSLIVWKASANLLSEFYNKPVKEINHVDWHIFSLFLERNTDEVKFPLVVLTASGWHNDLYLVEDQKTLVPPEKVECLPQANEGVCRQVWQYKISKLWTTLDDAAWECFDKVSKMLGGPYPGWPRISQKALLWKATPELQFPRIFLSSKEFNFSFSGMKSHIHYFLAELEKKWTKLDEEMINNIAFEFQEAVVEVLGKKLIKAWLEFWAQTLWITWWVSANDRLFEYTTNLLNEKINKLINREKGGNDENGKKGEENFILDKQVLRPIKKMYSTDNAAMIWVVGILATVWTTD